MSVGLNPGLKVGQWADWYFIAELKLGLFSLYFSVTYPELITFGKKPFWQSPLIPLPDMNVYNGYLFPGEWVLHFGVDNNSDGIVDWHYVDSVELSLWL